MTVNINVIINKVIDKKLIILMNNFQLYRTNVLLGGQIKWDVILNSSSSQLYVKDFNLSPISDNVIYSYDTIHNPLNNSHQDNVKIFYNSLRDTFYDEALDVKYSSNWPILVDDNEQIDCYSNVYDMGCKRSKIYNIYGKQFEFLCPVWIEKLDNTANPLKFEILIKLIENNTVISRNVLELTELDSSTYFHNKFVKYFNKYLSDSKLDVGDDKILNINFEDHIASVSGLDVSTGLFTVKSADALIDNFTIRERPLMETDYNIISSLKNNNIITKQLINFNLCFNIDDIISGAITDLLKGTDICISVNVYSGDKMLEKSDFYTEYEFIKKNIVTNIGDVPDETFNVFDYLHDNNALDLINKNKICQSICHWSLYDNNDYIFNLYNGFSGIYVDKKEGIGKEEISYYLNDHQYENYPDTNVKIADNSLNNLGWINTVEVKYWNEFYKYIANTERYKLHGSFFKDSKFVNNIKYLKIPSITTLEDGFYMLNIYTDASKSEILMSFYENLNKFDLYFVIELNSNTYMFKKDNLFVFVSSDKNNLTFASIKDLLGEYIKRYENEKNLTNQDNRAKMFIEPIYYDLLCNKLDPRIIYFDGGISWTTASGPQHTLKEIVYYNDNTSDYVMRYDGNIKPTFITNEKRNSLYYKDYISHNRLYDRVNKSKYLKYLNTGYEPLYPSLGYCSISRIDNIDYDNVPDVFISEHLDYIKPFNKFEYSWFNTNNFIVLDNDIKFTFVNKKSNFDTYKPIETIIREYIQKYYETTDQERINYILSFYDVEYDWEYYSKTNVDDYVYTINLKLK